MTGSTTSDNARKALLMVSSIALLDAADHHIEPIELRNGVKVTEAQARSAAKLIQDAEPSVIRRPVAMASTQERPAFIDADKQPEDGTLLLEVGILPMNPYLIEPDGSVR